jgi:hypothetical protein
MHKQDETSLNKLDLTFYPTEISAEEALPFISIFNRGLLFFNSNSKCGQLVFCMPGA